MPPYAIVACVYSPVILGKSVLIFVAGFIQAGGISPMNSVSKKLKSRSGASIAIALIFLAICVTVGAILITSAYSNSGRLAHMRLELQNYYTISSAVRLVRDEIEGSEFTASKIYEKTFDTSSNTIISENEKEPVYALSSAPLSSGSLSEKIKNCAAGIFESALAAGTDSFTVEVDGYDTVTVDITMDHYYALTLLFYIDEPQNTYSMTLTFQAKLSDVVQNTLTGAAYPVRVGTDAVGNEILHYYEDSVTTVTTTVSWNSGIAGKAP